MDGVYIYKNKVTRVAQKCNIKVLLIQMEAQQSYPNRVDCLCKFGKYACLNKKNTDC